MAAKKIAYPQPVPPVRFHYFSHPDLLDLPQVMKWEDEDELLTQLLMEMSLNDIIGKAQEEITGQQSPMPDEFTRGFHSLRREGEVRSVFSCCLLLIS